MRAEALAQRLTMLLVPRDGKDHEHNIILEIRPTAGGEEAGLFAREVLEMYRQHAVSMGWRAEVLTSTGADGGIQAELASVAYSGGP